MNTDDVPLDLQIEVGMVELALDGVGAASSVYPRWHESGVSFYRKPLPGYSVSDVRLTDDASTLFTSHLVYSRDRSAVCTQLTPPAAADSPSASPGHAPHEARLVEILTSTALSGQGPLPLTRCRRSWIPLCKPSRPLGTAGSLRERSTRSTFPHQPRRAGRWRRRSRASRCVGCWKVWASACT